MLSPVLDAVAKRVADRLADRIYDHDTQVGERTTVHGFDSFEGLPDDRHGPYRRGLFHMKGQLPEVRPNVKTIFDGLGDRLRPGSVIVFDEYFNYPEWRKHESKAVQEICVPACTALSPRRLQQLWLERRRSDHGVARVIALPRGDDRGRRRRESRGHRAGDDRQASALMTGGTLVYLSPGIWPQSAETGYA